MNIKLDLEMNESLISIAVSNTYIISNGWMFKSNEFLSYIYSNFCSRDEKEKF